MSYQDKNEPSRDDDDEKTLLDGKYSKSNPPASVVYMPENGSFSTQDDSTTLFEGVDGGKASSSSTIKGFASSNGTNKTSDMDSSIQQLRYNENKISLDRAINQSIELIAEISAENKARPVFYPANTEDDDENLLLNSRRAHLALVRGKETKEKVLQKKKIENDDDVDMQDYNDDHVTLSNFKIIKVSLKMGGHSQRHNGSASNGNGSGGASSSSIIVDKKTIAKLLENQFQSQIKYLLNLKDRIDDTSSKVFVTGDLNAGKSTFCNALLRRKVLPEDQQPCTSVFCEVIDAARENRGIEEVHAIPISVDPKDYDVGDESTYEAHQLKELDELVYECDKYSLLKVYVIDRRTVEQSLLRNGVVDVKLIDAPGLNMDSYQTTQVFSRQEEIDLVVFVVNSENHFTLSAKEFIATAAAEKRYVFIVVNKFDNIKDKEKCKGRILDQVKGLSPDSYKNADEFVHFVSSEPKDGGGDDGGDGDDDDKWENDPEFGGRFDHLEASLRKFLLDKRSISKLLPAKNYVLNLLNDLETLSVLNSKVYSSEKKALSKKLQSDILPQYDTILMKSSKINDSINSSVETLCTNIYDQSRSEIQQTILTFGDRQCVAYPGLQYLYEYAVATQRAMLDTVASSISYCEGQAKLQTIDKVDEVIKIGQQTLGDEFLNDKVFNSDLMFSRRTNSSGSNGNQLASLLDVSIEIGDFFDPSFEAFVNWLGVPQDLIDSTVGGSQAYLTYFNPVTAIQSLSHTALNIKDQIPSQLTLHTVYSSTKLLTGFAVARKLYDASTYVSPEMVKRVIVPFALGVGGISIVYLLTDIPNAFPRKQARKLRKQMIELDYPHVNAYRISTECRRVLNYPARQVMTNFQTSIDKRSVEKEKIEKSIADADLSYGYFQTLLNKIQYQKQIVEEIDLESVNLVD